MRKIRDYIGIIIFIIMLVVLLGLLAGLISMYKPAKKKQIMVGAVFIDDIDDDGWNEGHYNAILASCEEYNYKLHIVTNVKETLADTEKAVDQLVENGCNVIFLTSGGFGKEVYPVFEKYEDVQFYTIAADSEPSNAISYFLRIYQMRYLSGILAGMKTKSNVLGFVAASNTPQANRGINAFLLGARSVNPDVVVKVRFLGTWTDAEAEEKAARRLILEDGADVITYHASIHTAVDAAEELGVYSIGYNNHNTSYSDNYLASILCNWDVLYGEILSDFTKGNISDDKYYWRGILYDAVGLSEPSDAVTEEMKELVRERRKQLNQANDVFRGDLISNEGKVMCRQGERITDDALLHRMNWFLEGVEIYD
ncbi:BMP family ABC transporter substrate-binding protein [Butyrivibrio sp. WCE2006]|uniref:BMP family ABC transporter substrate-binding protein n=1 Tax=Butyrivibrio sp. WCE2006 TaxID=1410611 RepID=UPI000678F567|nr:BMP family ABC transporter substrate-binding protein [Butyrivibrio sp. WCE2006]